MRPLRLPLVEVPWWADWDLALLTAEAGWWLKMAGVLDKFGLVAVLLVLDCWVGSHWCLSNRLKIQVIGKLRKVNRKYVIVNYWKIE